VVFFRGMPERHGMFLGCFFEFEGLSGKHIVVEGFNL
jgi:hypothetical protein